MKYVLFFCADGDDVERFAKMSDQERADQYARVGAWFGEHHARITGGNQLGAPEMATTIRFGGEGSPLLTDGPFLEANEVIGGYCEVDVEDLDTAIAMAKTWPPRGAIEVRPVMESPDGPR
jgi:hypothetical protein